MESVIENKTEKEVLIGYQPIFNELPKTYRTGDDLTKFAK